MPNKDNNILKKNLGEKSIKIQDVIFLDIECLLEKISTCGNHPETKILK